MVSVRTRHLATPVVVFALALSASAPAPPTAADVRPGRRPSIVFILTDDQRWDTLFAMPNVQAQLGDHGITFANAFVSNAVCCPSRASILTGNYSHTTGVYRNNTPHGGFKSFNARSTIATWLPRRYQAALLGKYLNDFAPRDARGYVPPGWDRFVALTDDGSGQYYDYTLGANGRIVREGHRRRDYSTTLLAQKAVSLIENTNGPLFLYFAPHAPHEPATPARGDQDAFANLPPWRPENYNEADVSDKPTWVQLLPPLTPDQQAEEDEFRLDQLRSLLAVDRAVGDIVDALERTGRLQNTIIVFTSDNAIAWGEHRWIVKANPYEESMHVPLVVRYDKLIASPVIDDHLIVNIDFAPTFAELAGVSDHGAEGMSFLPLLTSPGAAWRTDFLLEHYGQAQGKPKPPTFCGLRTEHEVYVAYQTGEEELYDLTSDPGQLVNVVGDPGRAAQRAAMLTRLSELCDPPPPGGFTLPAP